MVVTEHSGSRRRFELCGELDLLAAAQAEPELVRHLLSAPAAVTEIDLRELAFMDAAGLRCLLAARNAAARRQVTLLLVAGPPQVQRVFMLTGTRGLFNWINEPGGPSTN